MAINYNKHNLFRENPLHFYEEDPHLHALKKLEYQHSSDWWSTLSFNTPGIYILTGGRQVGKSTSCKLLIKHCLHNHLFQPHTILYLPCDEIYDAKELSQAIRLFLDETNNKPFLLIIDEITFVPHWERVIKSIADEGYFTKGICLLTGSDTLILKEAAMSFPGRRGQADKTDFHLYPLSFNEYVTLLGANETINSDLLSKYFHDYLQCGGYLRAINDLAKTGKISQATYLTYEQWIRGDFLKKGKNENSLLVILSALLTVGLSPISYSSLTQKIGLISKDTCIDYIRLLERMDILIDLQAFDQNKKQGFPRKDRKFHFSDPFIQQTIYQWITREGILNKTQLEADMVEACVASHCHRLGKTFYFKGQGEIDVIWLTKNHCFPIEVKWTNQLRSHDLKMLKQWKSSMILGKTSQSGLFEGIRLLPVYQFLYEIESFFNIK
jgi:predicted AAA+ superfamily ATPase